MSAEETESGQSEEANDADTGDSTRDVADVSDANTSGDQGEASSVRPGGPESEPPTGATSKPPPSKPPPSKPPTSEPPTNETAESKSSSGANEDDEDTSSTDGDAPSESENTDEESTAEDTSGSEDLAPGLSVRYFGKTDVGLVRDHNEDNFAIYDFGRDKKFGEDEPVSAALKRKGIAFLVCDGMGGAAAGEVASQRAVDTIVDVMAKFDATDNRDEFAGRIVHAIEEAGSRIHSEARMNRNKMGMGTTATVAALIDEMLFVGQVGDSRAYVLREGALKQISKDQSLVNQLIEAGQLTEEEAEDFEHSNIILQALGTTENVMVDLTFLEVRQGDRLMLCSDGLSGLADHAEIERILKDVDAPDQACSELIKAANEGGGHDNVTCIVVDFSGDRLAAPDGVKPAYQLYPLPDSENRRSNPGSAPRATQVGGHGSFRALPKWFIAAALGILAFILVIAARKCSTKSDGVVVETEDAAPLAHQITVGTDTAGKLIIDGKAYGMLNPGEELTVELATGDHHFELYGPGELYKEYDRYVTENEEVFLRLLKEPRVPEPLDPGAMAPTIPAGATTENVKTQAPTQPRSPQQKKETEL